MNDSHDSWTEGAKHSVTCDACGGSDVTVESHVQTFSYGVGVEAVELTAAVEVHICSSCGVSYTSEQAETARHEAVCRHLGVMTPNEIRELRKETCGFTRSEFAEITGLGESTIGRWESGAVIQTLANDRYLRLLANPEILSELLEIAQRRDPREARPRPTWQLIAETPELMRRQETFHLRKAG